MFEVKKHLIKIQGNRLYLPVDVVYEGVDLTGHLVFELHALNFHDRYGGDACQNEQRECCDRGQRHQSRLYPEGVAMAQIYPPVSAFNGCRTACVLSASILRPAERPLRGGAAKGLYSLMVRNSIGSSCLCVHFSPS